MPGENSCFAYRFRRYKKLLRWRRYLPLIKEATFQVLPDARVFVFGSVVKGELTKESDLDILVISPSISGRASNRAIAKRGIDPSITELHVMPELVLEWYRRHARELSEI